MLSVWNCIELVLRLQESHKNDWAASVYAFKKTFFKKTARCAQIEAQALTKTNKLKKYALKVKQVIEQGSCNESAAIFPLK